MYIDRFRSLHSTQSSLISVQVSNNRAVFIINGTVYKVFDDVNDMKHEWSMIQICQDIYPTRYTSMAKKDISMRVIIFPELQPIQTITQSVIYDIERQIRCLNDNGVMHLDICKDNIMYDMIDDRYCLIDYGLSMYTTQILHIMTNYKNWKPYRREFREPQGFTTHGDIHALNLLSPKEE